MSAMAKAWKINLFLLLILLLTAAVLWWLDARDNRQVEADKAARAITSQFSLQESRGAKAVMRIEWQPPGQESDSMTIVPSQKVPGRWSITAPALMRTNDGAVTQLLGILGEHYDRKVADGGADSVQFGLQKPAAVLTVHNGAGESLQLSVGQSAPASKKQYLQIGAQGPVVLVASQAVSALLKNPAELRDKRLFANSSGEPIQRISRESAGGRTVLAREPEEPWKLLAPLADLASENRVEAWLNALTQASGTSFVPLKVEEVLKAAIPDWLLILENAAGEKETVRIHRQEKRLLAWREGEADALLLENYFLEELDKSAMELVALRPLPPQQIPIKLQVTHQGKTLVTAKKEGQWPKPAWSGVEDILTRDAWRGVEPQPHGEAWLTLTVFQDNEPWVIPFWKEGESVVLAPPNRPLELELTQYQSKAFEDTVKALFAKE